MADDSGSRSYSYLDGGGEADWPQTPGELVYHLDAVVETFTKVQEGRKVDLLDELLDCVNWREMFGSASSGFLQPHEIGELRRYYRAKFAGIERYYLAEQLSTALLSALMASGDIVFSEELKRLGREQPDLWQEIRAFFGRKEFTAAVLLAADAPRERKDTH